MAQCSDCGVDVSPQVEVLQVPRPEKVLPGGAALIGLGIVTAMFAGQRCVPGRAFEHAEPVAFLLHGCPNDGSGCSTLCRLSGAESVPALPGLQGLFWR